jgi:hypothetical protein
MTVWEADCYRRPCQDEHGNPLWELLLCDRAFDFTYGAMVSQSEATADWVQQQLAIAFSKRDTSPPPCKGSGPKRLRCFRQPQPP